MEAAKLRKEKEETRRKEEPEAARLKDEKEAEQRVAVYKVQEQE